VPAGKLDQRGTVLAGFAAAAPALVQGLIDPPIEAGTSSVVGGENPVAGQRRARLAGLGTKAGAARRTAEIGAGGGSDGDNVWVFPAQPDRTANPRATGEFGTSKGGAWAFREQRVGLSGIGRREERLRSPFEEGRPPFTRPGVSQTSTTARTYFFFFFWLKTAFSFRGRGIGNTSTTDPRWFDVQQGGVLVLGRAVPGKDVPGALNGRRFRCRVSWEDPENYEGAISF